MAMAAAYTWFFARVHKLNDVAIRRKIHQLHDVLAGLQHSAGVLLLLVKNSRWSSCPTYRHAPWSGYNQRSRETESCDIGC